jgi:hypothetical protein
MTCRYCDALGSNRDKPADQPENAVVKTGGLYVAPVLGAPEFEKVIQSALSVARFSARYALHAAATVVPTVCPGCGVALEGVLFECASYNAEVETFFPDLRPLADAAKPTGVVLFAPHWEGDRRCQLVVWSHKKLGEGAALADDVEGVLGAWVRVPAAVAGAFWLSWDAKKAVRGIAKLFGGGA